jgi:hypothetical protein
MSDSENDDMLINTTNFEYNSEFNEEQEIEIMLRRSMNIVKKEIKAKKEKGIEFSTNVLPFNFANEDIKIKYLEYNNNSNFIIIPYRMFNQLEEFNKFIFQFEDIISRPIVFKIAHLDIYLSVVDFIEDDYCYISDHIFNKYFNTDNSLYLKYIIDIKDITKIILEPLDKEFLNVKNQIEMFENNIGIKYRVLNKGFEIKSNDMKIKFKVKDIISNDNNIDVIGYCVDTNVIIDFYIPEDKLKLWNKEIEDKHIKNMERYNKLQELNGTTISTRVEEDDKPLSREELRARRLKKFNKNN